MTWMIGVGVKLLKGERDSVRDDLFDVVEVGSGKLMLHRESIYCTASR